MSEKPFFFFTLNMRCWVDVETVVVAEDVFYCRKTNNSQSPLPVTFFVTMRDCLHVS